MQLKTLSLAVAAALLLSACGDDNDDTPAVQTGKLVDSAVSGVEYSSPSQSGVTGANGEFQYKAGETVTFKIGGLSLGQAGGKGTLLLQDLAGGLNGDGSLSDLTLNRAVFLQSLDSDQDPANGLQISEAARLALKSASLDFSKAPAGFASDFATILKLVDAARLPVSLEQARDHLKQSTAALNGSFTTVVKDGTIDSIQSFVVPTSAVPYTGTDTEIKQQFPAGFAKAIGSGLFFTGKSGEDYSFLSITDRGPNGDVPVHVDGRKGKSFPVPAFAPTYARLTVGKAGVKVSDETELKRDVEGTLTKISGRPLSDELTSTKEIGWDASKPLNLPLTQVSKDNNGLDPEAIVLATDKKFAWTCDEYGPFLVKFEIATGKIVRKYEPGKELPAIIGKRQLNRGCEGLASKDGGKKLYMMIQSTLNVDKTKDTALFTRIVEVDVSDEAAPVTKMFAYPITVSDFGTAAKPKNAKLKLGDLASVGDTGLYFVIIEQGEFKDVGIRNKLYLVDLSHATDITGKKVTIDSKEKELEYATDLAAAGVTTASKYLIGDLRNYGWLMEKAEGLAVLDDKTLALINDNDFGLRAAVTGADGKPVASVEDDTTITEAGDITITATSGPGTYHIRKTVPVERATQLWIIKLAKPLLDFQPK